MESELLDLILITLDKIDEKLLDSMQELIKISQKQRNEAIKALREGFNE